jgi:Flp pilus assembly protein CpaB
MRQAHRPFGGKRFGWPPNPAVVTFAVIFLGFGALWATGIVDPKRLFAGEPEPSRSGLVAVPISAVAISAYSQLVREHFWNSQLGEMSFIYLPPNQVSPNMIRDFGQLLGRVLRREKPAGYVFTEDDFFAPGTRPGIVAGIPAGKRAMRVDSERVFGLQGLERGDRFDLLSVIALEDGAISVSSVEGSSDPRTESPTNLRNGKKQATVTPIVQNGLVIEPVGVRNLPTTSTSIIRGQQTSTKPVLEAVIAVAPEEVVRLVEALAVNAQLHCLPRSGRPDDDPMVNIPSLIPRTPSAPPRSGPPRGQAKQIEMINGTQRQRRTALERK